MPIKIELPWMPVINLGIRSNIIYGIKSRKGYYLSIIHARALTRLGVTIRRPHLSAIALVDAPDAHHLVLLQDALELFLAEGPQVVPAVLAIQGVKSGRRLRSAARVFMYSKWRC